MTRTPVTVAPDVPFKVVVAVLAEHGVTAVPVVDAERRLLGIVSEADLMVKESLRPGPDTAPGGLYLRPGERWKGRGETAAAVMSSPVFTARPEMAVPEAARVMERHHVKRLPVLDDDGRLVGIVSRADLLRVFLRDDEAIAAEILQGVFIDALWADPAMVHVDVRDGVVTLGGRLQRRSIIAVAVRLCEAVDGVVAVHAHLEWAHDDTGLGAGVSEGPGSAHATGSRATRRR
ncbi:CBS domain-containing protein [Streptomyces sp. RB6PN25]|uniref:CBS domain-containing protein n=1 Tax=Streptomyces humicola TaxID=2953240 RepID=A0ABT1PSH9_9ACTN|nr:CBS domain-containing protein [Streptomyces humicola]MCQ4080627.1 CBS domain-containing protein [Streptomyces humicola]